MTLSKDIHDNYRLIWENKMNTAINTKKIYSYAFFSKMLFELVIWMLFLKQMGWSIVEIGILQAIINFTQFFAEIPSGYIADRYGRRNTLALGQVLITIYVLSFFAAGTNHWLVYFGFFLYGLGLSLVSGADQSLIYDNISSKSYATIFGRYNAIAIIAIALSSFLGGYISVISWSLVFVLTAIMQVVALIIILQFDEERKVNEIKKINMSEFVRDISKYIRENPAYLYLVLVIGVTQGTISILYQYGSLFLSEFNFGTRFIATVFFFISIFGAAASYKIDKIITMNGKQSLIMKMFAVSLLLALLLLFDIGWIAVIVFFALNVIFEIWDTTLNTVLQDEVMSDKRTTMVSVVNQFTALLMGIESIIIGILSKTMSMNNIFILFGVGTFLLAIISFYMYIRTEKKTTKI